VQYAGFHVDFSQVGTKEMIETNALSFAKEYKMMTEMFRRILSLITPQVQQIFQKMIGVVRKRER